MDLLINRVITNILYHVNEHLYLRVNIVQMFANFFGQFFNRALKGRNTVDLYQRTLSYVRLQERGQGVWSVKVAV